MHAENKLSVRSAVAFCLSVLQAGNQHCCMHWLAALWMNLARPPLMQSIEPAHHRSCLCDYCFTVNIIVSAYKGFVCSKFITCIQYIRFIFHIIKYSHHSRPTPHSSSSHISQTGSMSGVFIFTDCVHLLRSLL